MSTTDNTYGPFVAMPVIPDTFITSPHLIERVCRARADWEQMSALGRMLHIWYVRKALLVREKRRVKSKTAKRLIKEMPQEDAEAYLVAHQAA